MKKILIGFMLLVLSTFAFSADNANFGITALNLSGGSVSATTISASGAVSGTGFTNYFASPPPTGSVTPNTGAFTTLNISGIANISGMNVNGGVAQTNQMNVYTLYQLAYNPLFSATTPTISSGFGTTPSIVNSNGTAAFSINVGTGGTASSGVITLPAATTDWNCAVIN